jgi:phosphinothricin acetyltransferase
MIRAALKADAPAIAALWNGMIRDTLFTFTNSEKSPADIVDTIKARPDAFWIAEMDGHLAGFMTFGSFRAGPGYAHTVEHSVVVADVVQGRGVAAALMARGEEAAAALGHHSMVAGISGANPRAVRFHERLGYAHVGRMPQVGRKEGQWLDLILMQKILQGSG